jgi:hypothetical protein
LSDAKKGSRDISELKQRLGLKKQQGQTGSTPRAGNGAGSGGVVAPPGLNLPPPPGMAPAAPPAPPPINAEHDPFGAMNQMAQHHIPQRAPEIVIVNDGRPVENVGAQSNAASLLRLAVPAAIALIVGLAIGKIGTSASFYNDGLKGAKAILGDKATAASGVAAYKKTLSDIDTALDEAKTKHSFRPDIQVDAQLKKLVAGLDIKPGVYALARNLADSKDDNLAQATLQFFAAVEEVRDMIEQHNKAAAGDDIALKKGKEAAEAANLPADSALAGNLKFAVVASAPSDNDKGADFGAKIVEIAGVYCGGGNTPMAKCPEGESPSAIAYRTEPGGVPQKGDLASPGSDQVPTKKLLTIIPNGISKALVVGAEPGVSEYYYTRRLRALYDRIHGKIGQDGKPSGGLLDEGNKLETRLQAEGNKGSRFSFFM